MVIPERIPESPPTDVWTTASIKNCTVMSRRLAPRARRMPISRVRSVTVASMMFMMPMPPTNSEMPAIIAIRLLKRLLSASASLRRSSGTSTLQSLRAPW